jgi:uncharacterized protein
MSEYALGIAVQWAGMLILYLVAAKVTYRGWEHNTAANLSILFLALIGLSIQTGFEELYLRGLICQITRRLTKSLPLVIGVQAYYFAPLHTCNVSAWGKGTLRMISYLVPALTWGWIAWRTGSLLMPRGLHFAKNALLVLFVNTEDDVIRSFTPFITDTPKIERASIFALGQALFPILAVEMLVRRGALCLCRS